MGTYQLNLTGQMSPSSPKPPESDMIKHMNDRDIHVTKSFKENLESTLTDLSENKANAEDVANLADILVKLSDVVGMLDIDTRSVTDIGTISDPTKIISLDGTNSQPASIDCKAITFMDFTSIVHVSSGAGLNIKADKVAFSSGTAIETQSSGNTNGVTIREASSITFNGTIFSGNNYNTVMTGQGTTVYPKDIQFNGCSFSDDCSHVYTWLTGIQDGGTVTFSDCTFESCEQVMMISDWAGKTNNILIKMENCVIGSYEKGADDAYTGFICLRGGTDSREGCKTEEEFLEQKPFSHVTFNFKNVTVGGELLTEDTFKMGYKDEAGDYSKQMLYLCFKDGSWKTYLYSEHPELFPTVVFLD